MRRMYCRIYTVILTPSFCWQSCGQTHCPTAATTAMRRNAQFAVHLSVGHALFRSNCLVVCYTPRLEPWRRRRLILRLEPTLALAVSSARSKTVTDAGGVGWDRSKARPGPLPLRLSLSLSLLFSLLVNNSSSTGCALCQGSLWINTH